MAELILNISVSWISNMSKTQKVINESLKSSKFTPNFIYAALYNFLCMRHIAYPRYRYLQNQLCHPAKNIRKQINQKCPSGAYFSDAHFKLVYIYIFVLVSDVMNPLNRSSRFEHICSKLDLPCIIVHFRAYFRSNIIKCKT